MKKQLDINQRQKMELGLENLMQTYKTIDNPELKRKTKKTVLKILHEYDLEPFGYKGIPRYMKD